MNHAVAYPIPYSLSSWARALFHRKTNVIVLRLVRHYDDSSCYLHIHTIPVQRTDIGPDLIENDLISGARFLRRNYVCLLVVGDLVDEDKLILFLKWGSFFVRRPLANRWVSVLETFGPLSGDKYWKRNPSEVCAQTKNRHSRSGRGATRWSDGCGWLVTCIHVRYNADDVPSRLPSRTPAIQSTILFAQVSELVCFSKWCDTITDLA